MRLPGTKPKPRPSFNMPNSHFAPPPSCPLLAERIAPRVTAACDLALSGDLAELQNAVQGTIRVHPLLASRKPGGVSWHEVGCAVSKTIKNIQAVWLP